MCLLLSLARRDHEMELLCIFTDPSETPSAEPDGKDCLRRIRGVVTLALQVDDVEAPWEGSLLACERA